MSSKNSKQKKQYQDLLWEFNPSDNRVTLDGKTWKATTLFAKIKDLPVFDVPVAAIDLHWNVWNIKDIATFIRHVVSVNKADLSYPIIFDEDGQLMDGYHRVCKAILENRKTIKAVRFKENPAADIIEKEDE